MYREKSKNASLEAFTTYLSHVGYQQTTAQGICRAVRAFLGWQEERPLTAALIQDYYDYLCVRPKMIGTGGLSSQGIRGHLYGLRIYFGYLKEMGLIEAHPMSGLLVPRPESRPREVLTKREVERLYEAAKTLRRPENFTAAGMLAAAYGCGLRRKELERLNVADVNFGASLLYVREGKGAKRRTVPMSAKVKAELRIWLEEGRPKRFKRSGDVEAFFLGRYGGRMRGDSFDRMLRQMLEEAGIRKRITLHCLRHSIATHLLQSGLPLEAVRDFLGHAYLESTQIYTRHERL